MEPVPPPAPPSPIEAAAAALPPPAAPASEGGGPGPVERLPPSAYPEEYTRGLYGGLAVAVVPRRAVAVLPAHRHRRLGLRVDRQLVPAAQDRRALGDVDALARLPPAGAHPAARDADLLGRQLLRPGAGGDRRQQGSVADAAAAGHRRRGRRLGAHRRMATVGPDARPLRGVRDLPPRHGLSTSTRRSGWARSTRTAARPTSTARRTCSIGRAAPATSRFTSIRSGTCASSCSRSTAASASTTRSAAARRSSSTSAG